MNDHASPLPHDGLLDQAAFDRICRSDAGSSHGCRLLDVRSADHEPDDHLPGSAWIPWAERLPAFLLPTRGRPLVTWGPSARQYAERLRASGWPAAWYEGNVDPGRLRPGRPTACLWDVDPLLRRFVDRLPGPEAGPVLDVGCGSSREGVFLAQRGYEVVLVDRLPDALELARVRARACGPEVDARLRTETRRLRRAEDLPDGRFSVILDFRFLRRPLLGAFADRTIPRGWLLMRCYGKAVDDAGLIGRGPRNPNERLDPDDAHRRLGAAWKWSVPPRRVFEDDALWVVAVGRRDG